MIGHVALFIAALVAAAATALGFPAPTSSEGKATRPAPLTGYAVGTPLKSVSARAVSSTARHCAKVPRSESRPH